MEPPPVTIPQIPSNLYLHHTCLQPRPNIILLGDSITEQGSLSNGWATHLSVRYNRRCDVRNRGCNGYNSRWGRGMLPLILEEILGPSYAALSDDDEANGATDTAADASCTNATYAQYTFLIGYGANDSCLPNGSCSRNHVPVDEYGENLKQMIDMIQSWTCTKSATETSCAYKSTKSVSVGLLTPPPCDTSIKYGSRDNDVTKLYAIQVMKIGKEMGVPVVDLWNGMQAPIQYDDESTSIEKKKESTPQTTKEKEYYGTKWKQDYLSDGLHLTPLGNYRVFELVVGMLEKEMGLTVENVPRQYPDHKLVDAEFPEKTFGTC